MKWWFVEEYSSIIYIYNSETENVIFRDSPNFASETRQETNEIMSFRAALDMARDKGVDVILINEALGADPANAEPAKATVASKWDVSVGKMPKPWDAVGKSS